MTALRGMTKEAPNNSILLGSSTELYSTVDDGGCLLIGQNPVILGPNTTRLLELTHLLVEYTDAKPARQKKLAKTIAKEADALCRAFAG